MASNAHDRTDPGARGRGRRAEHLGRLPGFGPVRTCHRHGGAGCDCLDRARRRARRRRGRAAPVDHRRVLGGCSRRRPPDPSRPSRRRLGQRGLRDAAPGRHVRSGDRRRLDERRDPVHGRGRLVEHRLHGSRRRCGGDRHRRVPGRGPRNARQGSQRAGPLDRVPGAEPQVPRHVRPRDVHGRTHRRARFRRSPFPTRTLRPRPIGASPPMPGSSASRSVRRMAAPMSPR